jgi:hypothetical protein
VRSGVFAFVALSLISCTKTPESETSKKIGEQPKQIIDKVTTDVNKALQKGTEVRQEADKKD